VRLTYDPEADAAYIQLVETVAPGRAQTQHHSIATPDERGELILDYDAAGCLIGVEVLGASAVLPPDVLAVAESPG